ncbi:hypothetical protein ACFQ0X_08780 [Streptomyces rectiviolaceus]|uniref:DUF3558 domain-containing protein n=1 Tax=Streptomyces rectiviolaceus TaxID=332591 RepID=A0ABP6N7P6_9ACTN
MSIPNPQPNQPNQPGQPNPYQQTPNPYQQPPGAVSPQPYGQPPGPYGQQPGPYGQPPAPPGPPAGPRKPTPGWVWGVGGVVVASALWAGALFATGNLGSDSGGGDDAKADLAGYQYTKSLCDVSPLDAFKKKYEIDSDSTAITDYTSRQKAFDQSYCSRKLKDPEAGADSYSSIFVYSTARWHKTTDPAGDFASEQKTYEDQSQKTYSYKTKAVSGIGDEAFLVTETSGTDDDDLNGMTLAVREGWFTFQMHWSSYAATDDKSEPPTASEVEEMLKSDTRAAMDGLKKS